MEYMSEISKRDRFTIALAWQGRTCTYAMARTKSRKKLDPLAQSHTSMTVETFLTRNPDT
jgi:hypothetical protein